MEGDLIKIENHEHIKKLIYVIRGKQVMLDSDLAKIYDYEVKRLNEQVKRNIGRFPEDFMFQLTKDEVSFVKSQIATSPQNSYFKGQGGGRRKLPYAFTEQGIYMLATVLRGKVAERQSIFIMRSFREMRRFLAGNKELFSRVSKIELKQLETDQKFEKVFNYIATSQEISQKVFFAGQIYDAFSLLVEIVQKASKSIILIDNYVDVGTLNILRKRKDGVKIDVYTRRNTQLSNRDIERFNSQYHNLTVNFTDKFHDRFLILDNSICYHIGASLKDAGNKSFAISKMKDDKIVADILSRVTL